MGAEDLNRRIQLHWAAKTGSYCAVEVMLQPGATDSKVDISGKLAVFYAVKQDHVDLARMLAIDGLNIDQVNGMGENVATFALSVGDN